MEQTTAPARYRRYTQLTSLIHLLVERELTLLDPSSWDDGNDAFALAHYREQQQLKSVLALCFTTASETYHHWRVFAPGAAGVRVSFDASRLRPSIDAVPGLRVREVEYRQLKDLAAAPLTLAELPFVKRHPYKPEKEVRLLWESRSECRAYLPVPIDLDAITDITLSPWLQEALTPQVRDVLKSIDGCGGLRVAKSTLIGDENWMQHARGAT